MNKKTVIIVLVALVVGLGIGLFIASLDGGSLLGRDQQDLTTVGNSWNFTNTQSPGGVRISSSTVTQLQVGSAGSPISEIGASIATISGTTNTSHAASTTKYYYASVTGVASGDAVFAQLASTSAAVTAPNGWVITSAKASSTAGYVDLMIRNLGTAAVVPSADGGFGSTTNILFLDI